MAQRLKLAAIRALWGGALLFGALNVPILGALVLVAFYPLSQLGLIPQRFTTSGPDVRIWFAGIELQSLDAALFYGALCAGVAFVVGLLIPPKRGAPPTAPPA